MSARGERYKAKIAGEIYYFTGRPCKHGHVSKRKTCDGQCHQCSLERGRVLDAKRYAANPAKHKARTDKWRKNNLDRWNETSRIYYAKKPEIFRESNRKWSKKNPDKKAVYKHTRRAKERNAEGRFTAGDLAKIRLSQDNLCTICKVSLDTVKIDIDHITPLSKGGSNWPDNIQLLCQSCNRRKGAKLAA